MIDCMLVSKSTIKINHHNACNFIPAIVNIVRVRISSIFYTVTTSL